MSNLDLKELLDSIDMEDFLGREGIRYKVTSGSSGTQLNLKECPVCGNSKWKVYLGAETGLGNCFSGSCESKFNKYSFIREYAQLEKRDLIKFIKLVASEQGWKQKRLISKPVFNQSLELPDSEEMPFTDKDVILYLSRRGVSSEIAKYFHLRYSVDGKFYYQDDGRVKCQDYSNRVIIPIHAMDGELVSFQGRDITGLSERKYLFPPGYSSTGKYLYNGHNAVGAKSIVVCEGVFDVMAVKMAFDEDVQLRDVTPVASFGKHLSNGFKDDQIGEIIKLKNNGLKNICFMWDSEKLAIKAAIKSALIVSSMGIKTFVAILPKGKDPNEAEPEDVRSSYYQSIPINRSTAMKLIAKLSC